jgi:hypothetical protein
VQGQQNAVYGRIEQLRRPRVSEQVQNCVISDLISQGKYFTWKLVRGRDTQFADFAVIFVREHICVYGRFLSINLNTVEGINLKFFL